MTMKCQFLPMHKLRKYLDAWDARHRGTTTTAKRTTEKFLKKRKHEKTYKSFRIKCRRGESNPHEK